MLTTIAGVPDRRAVLRLFGLRLRTSSSLIPTGIHPQLRLIGSPPLGRTRRFGSTAAIRSRG
jgi:hypothetical protein